MTDPTQKRIIEELVATLDIPESAYETAKRRYDDLSQWFQRPEARCFCFSPHIYPQGSFRLGTVIRPLGDEGDFDLDLGCRLQQGITKSTHTQEELKRIIGIDLEGYRLARGIKEPKEEMHRCWRLKYADTFNFHMDVVPSIPEVQPQIERIQESMIRAGTTEILAAALAVLTGAITDNRLRNYSIISNDWRISNSEGLAKWFESRMKLARVLLEQRAAEARVGQVDELPAYKWKSPLQRCVQILKRHRDVMFAENPESKPISIIITTLAGEAYQGETDIADALDRILSTMGNLVRPSSPRVPNPVNPAEDFADKWGDPKYRHLNLEKNFWLWLDQAKADFQTLTNARNLDFIVEHVWQRFGCKFALIGLAERLGLTRTAPPEPKRHIITGTPARPWKVN